MRRPFTWERGPFVVCPVCNRETLGILSAGGHTLTKRCTECRHSADQPLPEVEKRVLYLDQNAFSFLFAVESGTRLPVGHEEFCREAHHRLKRVVMLQQAILPHSDIHRDETTVFYQANALRRAYETIGGGIAFTDTRSMGLQQVCEFATAYINACEPVLNLDVDRVLCHERNQWLPDMRIGIDMDYSQFADGLRQSRDRGHADLQQRIEIWARDRPTFDNVLSNELGQFGPARARAFVRAIDALVVAAEGDNALAHVNAVHNYYLKEHAVLRQMFQDAGCSERESSRAIVQFWHWERNHELPHNRISAYLFAGLARRVVGGQRRVTRGFMNDVRAISAYSPYVDAMFVDRECAELLNEGRLREELRYRAKIFSFANPGEFLEYLSETEQRASDQVRQAAATIYGV